ncbi:hypothetical protein LJ754_02770 [Arthrobacter sp. zg-Y40]|uniref:hypothetical protein n=1 Tax=Arthrobacter sp. zg-Y40 TaxID=2886939 RepID=UPI001D13BB3A|nr:hypothetical protein [Arthrobacter sp. zg-Y40]MCC3278082.1 hypothetical protein [Arthrobacter sp. zg-Y40]
MGTPEPDAGRRIPGAPAGAAPGGADPAGADPAGVGPAGADLAGAGPAGVGPSGAALPGPRPEDREERPAVRSAAVVIVPTLLGLLGFFAVAAAVTSDAATVNVTAPGLLLAFTALVVAGVSPLYARNPTWRSLRRPTLLLAACLVVEAVLLLAAPHLVLFSLPALPLALAGGTVLLGTSLWGQFRKGPAPEPVLLPHREMPPRPFTSTLLVVAVNWLLFLSVGALCAWLLLGD